MVSGQTYLPIASKRPERNWRFTTHCRSRMFAFFETRGNRLQAEMFSFVYAGMKPDVDLAHQTEKDLLWIRHEFLSSSRDFGKIIIHGHTPTTEIELRSNRINIDTGAFATGRLTCLVIEGETLSVIDTVPNLKTCRR